MFYYPVYALYHYYPEAFWVRVALTSILFAAGVALIVILYKKGRLTKRAVGWGIAFWVYSVFLLFVTAIGRYSFDDYRARLIPFESYRIYFATGSISELRGIIGNVLMLIPFSFLCAQFVSCLTFTERKKLSNEGNSNMSDARISSKRPIVIALFAGLFLTVLIEMIQYITNIGTFEVDDIIHNTIGSLLGIWLWILFRAFIYRRIRKK